MISQIDFFLFLYITALLRIAPLILRFEIHGCKGLHFLELLNNCVVIATGRWSTICFKDKCVIKGHNKTSKGIFFSLPLLFHFFFFFFFFLQESLKNVERFPGDTNEKLSEMWCGIELKGQLLREIPL